MILTPSWGSWGLFWLPKSVQKEVGKRVVFLTYFAGFQGGPGTPPNLKGRLRGGNFDAFWAWGGGYRRGETDPKNTRILGI